MTTSDREKQAQQDRATAVEHEGCEAEHAKIRAVLDERARAERT